MHYTCYLASFVWVHVSKIITCSPEQFSVIWEMFLLIFTVLLRTKLLKTPRYSLFSLENVPCGHSFIWHRLKKILFGLKLLRNYLKYNKSNFMVSLWALNGLVKNQRSQVMEAAVSCATVRSTYSIHTVNTDEQKPLKIVFLKVLH